MGDESKTARTLNGVPIRVWPAGTLAAIYWTFQLIIAQMDMAMFPRFLSKSLGALAFLLLFLILWLANGTLSWRTRLAGLGAFLGSVALGIFLAHRSFDPLSFIMMVVPYVLTAWAAWMALMRRTQALQRSSLAAGLLLTAGLFDLVRWEGLDGHLSSTVSWRWSATAEQEFLATRAGPAAAAESSKPWTLRESDWPEFRGPLRDGVVRGVRIATNWREAPPEKVWKQGVGPGWSSVIVVGGFLVTQEQRGENEAVVCYEAETGRELWAHEDVARFSEGIAGPGPRATPTYRDGRIYSFGASGLLTCLEAPTGKRIWSRDVAREASVPLPQWGYSASPLVVDGKVIVFAGGSRGVASFDSVTGAPGWSLASGKDSYSSAHLVPVRGKPQIVMQDNKRMVGLAIADGAVLWERPNESEAVIPMLQPSPRPDGMLLVSSGQDLALLELREEAAVWKAVEKWTTPRFKPSFNDFVVHEGHAYGLDEGVLSCVDLRDGRRVWKKGRYGGGQLLLLADQGLLLILSEKGELALVEARPQEPGEVFRFPAIEGKTWNHPVLVGDRVYVRNAAELASYRLRAAKSP
jgi:outer membrane protein assembly factor BamB